MLGNIVRLSLSLIKLLHKLYTTINGTLTTLGGDAFGYIANVGISRHRVASLTGFLICFHETILSG
jgi:hypothetical protein